MKLNLSVDDLDDLIPKTKLLGPDGHPFKIEKETRSTRGDLQKEIGAGGVSFFQGLIDSDEFNAKLEGRDGVEQYDRMRRTDAQVAALINAVTLPILSASWRVDLPSEEEEADNVSDEHLEFAEKNLFTRIDWQGFLRHALSCTWAGYSWFEKIYVAQDGQLCLKRLSPRLATTLSRWWTDDAGELVGVQQEVWKAGHQQRFDIPRDKIALFVYDQEANNYQGNSILRPTYKHWLIKDALYKVDAVRHERHAIGIPVIELPEEYDQTLLDRAVSIGKNWRGGAQSYVVLVAGMKVDIKSMDGASALDLIPTIQHHNEEIAKAFLAQFINYGTTQSGSRALGEVSTSFFYDAIEGLAHSIARTIEREVLWPLLDLNYANRPRPEIVVDDLGSVSMPELIESLKNLNTYVTPDLEIENHIRERLRLPLREEEDETTPEDAPSPEQAADPQDVDAEEYDVNDGTVRNTARFAAGDAFWREVRPDEEYVALRQIDGTIEDTRDRIMRVLLSTRNEWADSLVAQFKIAIEQNPASIDKVDLFELDTLALVEKVSPLLEDIYLFGGEQVRREMEKQAKELDLTLTRRRTREHTIIQRQAALFADADNITPSEAIHLLITRAGALVRRLSRRVVESARAQATDLWRTIGRSERGIAAADLKRLSTEIRGAVEAEARMAALTSSTEALNLGRDAEAQRFADQIQTSLHSEILDGATCAPCRAADGFESKVGTAEYYDTLPPLHSRKYGACEGRSRCRGIKTYVLKTEQRQDGEV